MMNAVVGIQENFGNSPPRNDLGWALRVAVKGHPRRGRSDTQS